MRRTGLVCALWLVGMATGSTAAPSELDGTWQAYASDGSPIVWQMGPGRVRIGSRPADLEVRGDSLVVRFDAPAQAAPGAACETAVYRFLLGGSQRNPARLFVYGFDLGPQGLYLERTDAPPPAEDAAPAVPPNGSPGKPAPHTGPTAGPQARSSDR